jgi:nucleotide-binding universal stress UspA family protein
MLPEFYSHHKEPKNILLATDDSNEVAAAERYAIDFAHHYNCRLHVLHVFPPIEDMDDYGISYDEYVLQHKHQKENELNRKFTDIARLQHVDVFYIAEEKQGTIAETILDYALMHNIDMLIVGAHGSSGYGTSAFGSVTAAVLKGACLPVMIVPAFAGFASPATVGLALKGLDKEIAFIEWLLQFLQVSDIRPVHVTADDGVCELTGFQNRLPATSGNKKTQITYTMGDSVASALNEFVVSEQINMLVMMGHPRSFFHKLFAEDVVSRMAYQIVIPLLYLPDKM